MRPRRSFLILAASAALIVIGMAGPAAAHGAAVSEKPKVTDFFSPQDLARSRAYNGPRYTLGLASIVVGFVVAAVLGLGAPTRALGAWAQRLAGNRWPVTALILVAVVSLAGTLVTLPMSVARNLYHERRWELSTQTLGGYLNDVTKGTLIQIVIAAVGALGFYLIVRRLPRGWPFAAGGFAVALTVTLVVIYPLVFEPVFNKFTPVDGETATRIRAIATKAGVKVGDVLVADASRRTRKLNAYVSGLGPTKRVVLYDTLLESSPPEEIDLIVAHELGHVVHRDVARGTLLGAAGAIGAIALIWLLFRNESLMRWIGASPGDPRSLPFLAFVLALASFLTLPATNAFSRHIEASADRFAVELTDEAETAVETEISLARRNIADLQPNAFIRVWFYTHPPVMDRIQIALEAAT
jgi:Zn-dependent protease with chaperone function